MSTLLWEYDRPYPTGPMVGPELPHLSYPPDAAPKHTPTKNSPAHKAYKRALCRGGRWGGWIPNSWDEAFSNAFSHGKTGGYVVDSGIAGFQRQMGIQPTGWVGKGTYDAMRSARVPDGLPNAGTPLFDSICINQLVYAGGIFVPPVKTIRQLALIESIKYIGIKEAPYGSNKVVFSDWYGMVGPWCAMFVTYCFENVARRVGKDSQSFVRGVYYAYVPYILNDARAQMRGLSIVTKPIPGDLVLYDWNRNGVPDHIGIFEKGDSVSWTAIEGNTSTSSDSNGGAVMRRHRNIKDSLTTFVRVAEPN